MLILAVGRLEKARLAIVFEPYIHHVHVVLLVDRGLVEGTENLIEEAKCALSPDDETTKVSTGGELEEVQSPDVDELDTRDVAESLDDTVVFVVDNERSTALAVTAVAELALASTELAGVRDLDDIGVRAEGFEESDSLLGLGEALNSGVDDEGDLLDLLDAVTTSENKRREG